MKLAYRKEQWRDWLMLLFGAWLVVSPFVLGYGGTEAGMAMWNSVIIGLALVVFSIAVLIKPHIWEEWVSLILGAWLIISPFVLGFSDITPALWNTVIMGLLVGGDAIWSVIDMRGHKRRHTA
jgi:hypothetical protein